MALNTSKCNHLTPLRFKELLLEVPYAYVTLGREAITTVAAPAAAVC